jgi:pimeloyl-ACP methyl ester carboxylesterase
MEEHLTHNDIDEDAERETTPESESTAPTPDAETHPELSLEEVPETHPEIMPEVSDQDADALIKSEDAPPTLLLPGDVPASKAAAEKSRKKIPVRLLLVLGTTAVLFVFSLQYYNKDIPVENLKAKYAFPDSRFMQIEGMEVHVRVSGKGTPILLLHDEFSSLHTWNNWTQQLAAHYQVISVDLPGFGLTGPHPQGDYSAEMYMRFMDSLFQKTQVPSAYLAGSGFGGKIAWLYAAQSGQRLQKLILLNAGGFEKEAIEQECLPLSDIPVLSYFAPYITSRSDMHRFLEKRFFYEESVSDSLVQRHFDLLLRTGNRQAAADRSAVEWPEVEQIASISTPSMVVWGAEDRCSSFKNAYLFHQKIPHSALRIYPGTGHWPQEENANKTVQEVMRFLEGSF